MSVPEASVLWKETRGYFGVGGEPRQALDVEFPDVVPLGEVGGAFVVGEDAARPEARPEPFSQATHTGLPSGLFRQDGAAAVLTVSYLAPSSGLTLEKSSPAMNG